MSKLATILQKCFNQFLLYTRDFKIPVANEYMMIMKMKYTAESRSIYGIPANYNILVCDLISGN